MEKVNKIQDGLYRFIPCDDPGEQFDNRDDFISRLVKLSNSYDLAKDIDLLVSQDGGWYVLDAKQIEAEIESIKFNDTVEYKSDRLHEKFERDNVRAW